MTSCPENSCYGNVEEEQYSWVDINWPVMVSIKIEVIGQGAVPWYDDVLQTKEPGQKRGGGGLVGRLQSKQPTLSSTDQDGANGASYNTLLPNTTRALGWNSP